MKINALLSIWFVLLLSCTPEPMKAHFSIQDYTGSFNLDNIASVREYTIHSNTEWKISNDDVQSWCTITPAQGARDGKISVSVTANTGKGRLATFKLTGKGISAQTLQVQQGEPYAATSANEFPIIAWTGIEPENAYNKFIKMKNAGINTYLGWYDNVEIVKNVLDAAERAGVKIITSCPGLTAESGQTVPALMNHPALYGYHLADEPETGELEQLGLKVQQIQSLDNYHPCYINLYPNWAWGKEQYSSNVALFLEKAPVPFLSFDNYPIVSIDGNPSILRPDWYRNLEEIAAVAKKHKIPFWAFALALSHRLDASYFYQVPTLPELRLQVFSNLAYGAQAIQYFTFHGIYIDNETEVYDRVKTVNQEVQKLTPVFLGATVTDVWHTGPVLPEGTRALGKLPDAIRSLSTEGTGAVVSLLENKGQSYLVIVNKDYRNPMKLTIDTEASVSRLSKEGIPVPATDTKLTVDPGDCIIYTWKKK